MYELLTLFATYTGLRAEELAGCEVRDLVFKPGANGTNAEICVRRSKKRVGGQWIEDNLKSTERRREVPLPAWLAGRMADYLADDHDRADEQTAPLGLTVRSAGHAGGVAERSHRSTPRSR